MDILWLNDTIRSINWATLSNIAVVVSAIFLILQLQEMRHATHAQAYSVAVELLQKEEVRRARRDVFQLKGKSFEKWSAQEIKAAEMVCHTYDAVSQMVRHHLLQKNIIINSWGPSLRNSWPILFPMISKYRQEFDAPEFWDDYEWLASEAIKIERWRQRKKRMLQWLDVPKMIRGMVSRIIDSRLMKSLASFLAKRSNKK